MIYRPHGETNVTMACQNRCVSCNHFIPLQSPWFCDPAVLERDLSAAAKLIHFKTYNLVGGEPTLHPAIVDLLKIVRASGIADRREITTNGQAWRKWAPEFYENIDDLIVTPYKLDEADRSAISDRCAEYGVALQWHPVIFTYAAYKQPDAGRAERLYRGCWYRYHRLVIDEGYLHRCCIGRFIPELLQGRERNADAIALDGLSENALQAYLDQGEVPAMCLVCGSNNAPVLPWREQGDPAQWREDSLL